MIFGQKTIQKFSLPVTDEGAIKIIEAKGMEFILALEYAEVYFTTSLFLFLSEQKHDRNTPLPVAFPQDIWMNDEMISGQVYLTGDIWLKDNKNFLIGIYSFEKNRKGFVWADTFRGKLLKQVVL